MDSLVFQSGVRYPGQSQAKHLFVLLIELYVNKHEMQGVLVCLTFCIAIKRNNTYHPITLSPAKVGWIVEGSADESNKIIG